MHTIIGVMGGGEVDEATRACAHELGRLIAEEGWVLLNGGRNAGVMAASAAGAAQAGGLTVGILPDSDTHRVAPGIAIPILTGMGDARNVINVLSSHVVIALNGGTGTVSEVAHALNCGRPVITLGLDLGHLFAEYRAKGLLVDATSAAHAITLARGFISARRSL